MGAAGAGAGDAGAGARWVTLLVLYHLCCWPPDTDSDTSSDRSRRRGLQRHESGSHRRASEFFSRRMGSSAASLHLPSTSGQQREAPPAHRSHEEIGRRRSHGGGGDARYHSAPSVIDEVLHRRDWERSARDLYIPLRPPADPADPAGPTDPTDSSPDSEPEPAHTPVPPPPIAICKKHHTNIKSSNGKEKRSADDKDLDATELYHFYIGDNECGGGARADSPQRGGARGQHAVVKAKEAKQSLNESIRSMERACMPPPQPALDAGAGLRAAAARLRALDRSPAARSSLQSRLSGARTPLPPPSVEAVGYEGGTVYLCEGRGPARPPPAPATPPAGLRARHASDGDILAPAHRPESGAFSESDLYLEAEGETTPARCHEPPHAPPDRKETAI